MTKIRNALLFVFVIAGVCLVSIGTAKAYIPREPPPDLHRICYLGHIGQPSRCVWVHV